MLRSLYQAGTFKKGITMTTLGLLLIIPLLWPIVAKAIWKNEITFGELAINLVVGIAVVVLGWAAGRHLQMADSEVLNGELSQKYSERVSCEHSYQCNCRKTCTGSGKDRSCSETCDTCYEHNWDVDWVLDTTVGKIKVDRVNRQGTQEPPRFSRAQQGDPVARTHVFENYIKAAPDSLFNAMSEQQLKAQFAGKLPAYPLQVYDLYNLDHVLVSGFSLPDLPAWNRDLSLMLRTLGPAKQVNVVVVFVNNADSQYAQALRAEWLGGKKNDVVVVIGTTQYPKIDWVSVFSWTDKELFKVQLRDDLSDLGTADRTKVLGVIQGHVSKSFVRKPMADFAYLQDLIEPPTWVIGSLVLLSLVVSVGLSVYLARNETRSYTGFGRYSRFNK
jgi:hypothetical protein